MCRFIVAQESACWELLSYCVLVMGISPRVGVDTSMSITDGDLAVSGGCHHAKSGQALRLGGCWGRKDGTLPSLSLSVSW